MSTTSSERHPFKAELKQLLHIITHSLYSNPEIFLRELISNASDAINKIKFDSLNREDLLEDNKDWKIKIIPDNEAGTLTIRDNGIGMSREEVAENLGTIAKSGTRAFLEAMRQQNSSNRPDLIGQFGVGFYSAFMVADKVTVHTRPAGGPSLGTRWESEGQGEFSIEPAEKADRGTDVILHLKPEAKQFLNEWRLRTLIKKFSDFIEHPVVMDSTETNGQEKITKEEILNARKAIWLRNKSEITTEEYHEFYKQISHDTEAPAHVIHYLAEGNNEFRVLAFIPAKRPFSMRFEEPKAGLRLYIQRVLIMEKCQELLPQYLRFVQGVVDSSDLPLNISREMLQENPTLEKIQKNIVRNVLQALESMKNNANEKYITFFQGLGEFLKEGLTRDWSNREKLADLLLFESANTPAGQYTTFAQYLDKMPSGQKAIYYLIGDNRDSLVNSPLLEPYRKRGEDVLLLTDSIDEWVMPSLGKYKDKELKPIDRAETQAENDEVPPETRESYAKVLKRLKEILPEVSDVRLTNRLTDSAAVLVAEGQAISANMERLLKRMGQLDESEVGKRVLELNPANPLVQAIRELFERTPEDSRIETYGRLLYEQAVITEGSKLRDPSGFARRINEILLKDAKT